MKKEYSSPELEMLTVVQVEELNILSSSSTFENDSNWGPWH